MLRLLPRAEIFFKDGASARQAWGRASAEFPELRRGRALLENLLVWKTSTGNLERRFRVYKEFAEDGRPRLLDTTTENCLIASMGPPAGLLKRWCTDGAVSAPTAASTPNTYLSGLARMHAQLFGQTRYWKEGYRQERRDAGVARGSGTSSFDTEAGFERKRAAAIRAVVEASPTKRARIMEPLAWLQDGSTPVEPTTAFVARVAKRAAEEEDRNLRGKVRAEKARAKLEQMVVKAAIPARSARDMENVPRVRAGVALVRAKDERAWQLARRLSFKCLEDPADFAREVLLRSKSNAVGHLVLVPVSEISDFGVCARAAAMLMGTYRATPSDFVSKSDECGYQYEEQWRQAKSTYRVAVSEQLAVQFPTLPTLLGVVAAAPGSSFEFYSTRRLEKIYQKEGRENRKIAQHMCVLATEAERDAAPEKVRPLYKLRVEFAKRFTTVREKAFCPGFKGS